MSSRNRLPRSRQFDSCIDSRSDPFTSRRAVLKGAAALLVAPGFVPRPAKAATPGAGVDWYVTTAASPWQKRELAAEPGGGADVFVQTDTPLQAIEKRP